MKFQPAFTKNAYVYEELRRRILSGDLAEGQPIAQGPLAAELGVSTTPMREALRRLGAEGMVTIDAHRDARVARLTADEAHSLFEIRERLDPLAAGQAARRGTAEEIREIEEAARLIRPLSDGTDLDGMAAHREFHRTIHRASHNLLLLGLLESLWDKADRYRQVALRAEPVSLEESERVRREHEALTAAIVAREPDLAEQIALEHVAHSLGRRAIEALSDN